MSHNTGEEAGDTDHGMSMTGKNNAVKTQVADEHEVTQENIYHILSKKKKKSILQNIYSILILQTTQHPNYICTMKQEI